MATSSCVLQTGQNDMRTKYSLLQIYPTEVFQFCSFRFLLWCLLAFKALYAKGHQKDFGKGKFKGVTFVLAFFHLFSPLRNSESPPPPPHTHPFPPRLSDLWAKLLISLPPPLWGLGKKALWREKERETSCGFSFFSLLCNCTVHICTFPAPFLWTTNFWPVSLIYFFKHVTLPSMHIVYDMSVCTQL